MTPERTEARGVWQFAAFALAVVLAALVWLIFPEPEESRRGYTPKGCYDSGKWMYVTAQRLVGDAHSYPRSERYLTTVRYFEALEERFGIGTARKDAYEMLGDARHELAIEGEKDPMLRESFGLDAPRTLREGALRAYRGALACTGERAAERPILLRKDAQILVELGRPEELDEALGILNGLVKLYRQDKVDSLRRERAAGEEGERLEFVSDADRPSLEDAAAAAEEARTVYFLMGQAAQAAADYHLAAARGAPSARAREEKALAEERSHDAESAYRLFTDAGGAGERRVEAEQALGDLAFRRAQQLGGGARFEALKEARTRYAKAGTRTSGFLLARVLFGLGEYEDARYVDARRRFARVKGVSPAESRARRYMVARCDLAMRDLAAAARGFETIHAADPQTAEGVASLVGLARIALAGGELDGAAGFLSRAVHSDAPAGGSMELPERENELEPAGLAGMLESVAREFDRRGDFDRAVELYADAAERDPAGPVRHLKLIARAREKQGAAAVDRVKRQEALRSAAETYVEMAGRLPPGPARREAERLAAEDFAGSGLYSRAIEVARPFVVRYPDDPFASRVLHELGSWEARLGLSADAEEHFSDNVERHSMRLSAGKIRERSTDVYADRSLLERVKLLAARGSDEDLRRAAGLLREILADEHRYGPESYARLRALFMLGCVDLRRAERLALAGGDPAGPKRLFAGAAAALEKALAFRKADFSPEGPGARPLFAELLEREGSVARKALDTARARLAGIAEAATGAEPLTPEEADRRWEAVSAEIEAFPAELAGVGGVEGRDARKD
jgi:hypothetical protein